MSPRGTTNTNTNTRGSAEGRRRRKEWLIETYRADVDLMVIGTPDAQIVQPVERGWGDPACRCYRCGNLLSVDTVTVDRIIPQAKGGTYKRNNIRPACMGCNSRTGTALRERMKRELVTA